MTTGPTKAELIEAIRRHDVRHQPGVLERFSVARLTEYLGYLEAHRAAAGKPANRRRSWLGR